MDPVPWCDVTDGKSPPILHTAFRGVDQRSRDPPLFYNRREMRITLTPIRPSLTSLICGYAKLLLPVRDFRFGSFASILAEIPAVRFCR